MKNIKSTSLIVGFGWLIIGCGLSEDLNRSKNSFTPGLNARVQIDIPYDSNNAIAAAAVYQDGVRQPLVAGDVFVVESGDHQGVLKTIDDNRGGYTGTIIIEDATAPTTVTIQHLPTLAREDRWYPVDIIQTDPGPGRYVGRGVTVNFPDAVEITGPAAESQYLKSDSILLQWQPAGDGDDMEASANVICYDGSRSYRYGRELNLSYNVYGGDIAGVSDDGEATIPVNELLVSESTINAVLAFGETLANSIFGSYLYILSGGLIEPDFDYERFVIDYCDIDLVLFRNREGLLDAEFTGGYARGSRSDYVPVIYQATH